MTALALSSEDRVLEAAPSRRLGGLRRREGEPVFFEGLPRVPVSMSMSVGRGGSIAAAAMPWPRVVAHPPAKGIVREIPPVAPPPPRDAPIGAAADATLAVIPTAAMPAAPVRRRSLRALLAALALHGAVALAALIGLPETPPEGGGLPEEATMVEFVDLGSNDRVDSEAGAPAPPVETREQAEAVPVEPPIEPAAWATAVAETPIEPIVVSQPEAEAPPVVEPEPIETPPVVATIAAEETVPPPPARPETVTAKPAPVKPARPEKPRRETKPMAERSVRDRERRPQTTAATGSVERRAGVAAGGAAAATAGELRSWRAAVLAALARAKRYPEAARALGESGRAVVTFTVGRDGRVAGVALAGSSGVAVLDRATLEMPHRASFPPLPAGVSAAQTFTAGVRYDLH